MKTARKGRWVKMGYRRFTLDEGKARRIKTDVFQGGEWLTTEMRYEAWRPAKRRRGKS